MSITISRWIRWPGYAAWFFFALVPLSIMMVRSGNWKQGLVIYALAGLLSIVILAVLAVLSLIPRLQPQRGSILKRALPALPGAALLLVALSGESVPAIHDISTDLKDPPVFEAAPTLRGPDTNSLALKPDTFEEQQRAYPDVRTIRSPRSYASSYNLALTTARSMQWEITREDGNAGFIEAVASTALMNFKDDIVIRIRTNADGSLVDLRSVSRVGISDMGANAKRIRAFTETFLEAAERN